MAGLRRVTLSFRWQTAYWATVVGVALVVVGFAALLLAGRGAAGLSEVPLQLPYGISGGVGGLTLVAFGAVVIDLQVTRHLAARERAATVATIRQAGRMLDRATAGTTRRG